MLVVAKGKYGKRGSLPDVQSMCVRIESGEFQGVRVKEGPVHSMSAKRGKRMADSNSLRLKRAAATWALNDALHRHPPPSKLS